MSSDARDERPDELPYPFGEYHGLELHALYRRLQDHRPLCPVRMPYGEPALLATRYEDVKTVLGDPRFRRAVPAGHDQPRVTPEVIPMGLMEMDPPDHTRIRRLIAGAFSARRAERQRPSAEALAHSLLDDMLAAGSCADLVESYSVPLPIGVICDLLGVPYDDRATFHQWIVAMNELLSGNGDQIRMENIGHLTTYMADLVVQRQGRPTDDLIGELARAQDEDERLSEEELVFLCMLLLVAGYETTSNQIGNFVHLLLTHPGQLALLRERPELLPQAVEELLRFTPLSVSAAFPRYAAAPVKLGDEVVAEGQPVLTSTSEANRDPRVFEDPDRLDITRPITGHLGFGWGAHHCVGASLARMELQVALGCLLDRLPGLRLAVDAEDVTWKRNLLFRGPGELPIAW
ncbi:cytochrome P450 [Streptomyces sp. NPDC003032]